MNIFASLPVPAGNGIGAAVDVSAMGRTRTIVVEGPFQAAIQIEISQDGVTFGPLTSFSIADNETLDVAAQWMRVRVSGTEGPGTPTITVGSNDIGSLFAALPVPVANGFGAAVDVSALGQFKTIIIDGPYLGAIEIQVSEDGATYSCLAGFSGPQIQSMDVQAQFMRIQLTGYVSGPLPIITVGAVNDPAGATTLNQLDWKEAVRVATTVDIPLAGLLVIDGIATVVGDRVLVKDQALGQNNGIYVAAAGAWVRSADANSSAEVTPMLAVGVSEGATQKDTYWGLDTNAPIVLGVTPLLFTPLEVSKTVLPTTILPDDAAAIGASPYAARANHVHAIAAAIAVTISDALNDEGVSLSFSRADHLHAHGDRGGGSLHALATILLAGFMSPADKIKLDGLGAGVTDSFVWGNENVGAAADTRYLSPGSDNTPATLTAGTHAFVVGRPGTLKNLFARHNAAVGNGNAVVYTLLKNGVATLLTASLVTGAVGQASNLVNLIAVVQGDRIEMQAAKALIIAPGGVDATVTVEFA